MLFIPAPQARGIILLPCGQMLSVRSRLVGLLRSTRRGTLRMTKGLMRSSSRRLRLRPVTHGTDDEEEEHACSEPWPSRGLGSALDRGRPFSSSVLRTLQKIGRAHV